VDVTAEDASVDVREVVERAQAISTVANSLARGIPVSVLPETQTSTATAVGS
jgi:hypothetical protein